MSGGIYLARVPVTAPRCVVRPDGTAAILLDEAGANWLTVDDAQTAAMLAEAADELFAVHKNREAAQAARAAAPPLPRRERMAEIDEARRPRFVPREQITPADDAIGIEVPAGWPFPHAAGSDREHGHPYAPAESAATTPDSAPAHTGDGTPGPASAVSTLTAPGPGPGGSITETPPAPPAGNEAPAPPAGAGEGPDLDRDAVAGPAPQLVDAVNRTPVPKPVIGPACQFGNHDDCFDDPHANPPHPCDCCAASHELGAERTCPACGQRERLTVTRDSQGDASAAWQHTELESEAEGDGDGH